MRVFDLATLPPPSLEGPGGVLMLSNVVAPGHVDAVLAWWLRSFPELPQLVGVDWHQGLYPSSRRLLDRLYQEVGVDGVVQVRVPEAGEDLAAIAADPILARFPHLVVITSEPARGARLRRLAALAREVTRQLEAAWTTRAPQLGLNPDEFRALRPLLDSLLDPAAQVAVVNDRIELELEGVAAEHRITLTRRRLVAREAGRLTPRELVVLAGVATGRLGERRAELVATVGERELDAAIAELQEQDLLLEGELRRWGPWLTAHADLFLPRAGLPARSQRLVDWDVALTTATTWMRALATAEVPDWADPELEEISVALQDGELELARSRLDALTPLLPTANAHWRSGYWLLVGRLRMQEQDLLRAELAFRSALEAARDQGVPRFVQACLRDLAKCIVLGDRCAEAEPLLREALRLQEAGGASEGGHGAMKWVLAYCLVQGERWTEAEPLIRESLALMEGPDTIPADRDIARKILATCLYLTPSTKPDARQRYEEALQIASSVPDADDIVSLIKQQISRLP